MASLRQKAASGLVWTSIQKFTGMAIQFISGIVLARLLTPEDYGSIGLLAIFMVIANAVVDGGFASALIQKKRPTQEDYSTIFYWNLGMSFVMYALLFIAAPIIARYYRMPLLSSVLRVQGIVLIINAFLIIQSNQLRKQLRFKKLSIVSLAASVIAVAVTILMAYKGFGVWSLVMMNILSSLIPAIVYWLTNKWHPILVFSVQSFRELFGFGFYMFLTNMLNSICNNLQGLLIGRLYSPTTMGYYSKAKSTEELASSSISNVMGNVTYPLYAEYQNDKSLLAGVIKRVTCSVAYLTFPIMFLLILIARPLFVILYSDTWLDSVPYFQILCVAGIAICLQGVNYQAVAAVGKSKAMFGWTVVKRVVGICLIIGGLILWGIKGLLVGMVLQSWLIYLINAFQVHKYIGYLLYRQLANLLPILLLSLSSFVAAYCVVFLFQGMNMYVLSVIRVFVFAAVYFAGSLIFKIDSYKYIVDTFLSMVRKNRVSSNS